MIILIEAGPGCGKTHTLAQIAYALAGWDHDSHTPTKEQDAILQFIKSSLPSTKSVGAAAYNTSARDQLKDTLPDFVECKTSHGHAFALLNAKVGFQRLNGRRPYDLVQQITSTPINNHPPRAKGDWYAAVALSRALKGELLDSTPEHANYVSSRYSSLATIDLSDSIIDKAAQLLKQSRKITGQIDYDDQLYLPFYTGAIRKKFDVLLVDECQDLSTSRLQLALQIAEHVIFVGDSAQAINAFAGALPDVFETIREMAHFIFPLKTCFRCPRNAIEAANRIRPSDFPIQTSNPPGPENRITFSELASTLDLSSPALLLSRTNANLIRTAIALTRQSIPNYINSNKSSPVASALMSFAKMVARSPQGVVEGANHYIDNCRKPDHIKINLKDYADGLSWVMADSTPRTWVELETRIKDLFKKPRTPAHQLSTIHRAKGLENSNIYALFPPIQHPLGQKDPIQAEQEKNLEYVARTRTKHAYTEVTP